MKRYIKADDEPDYFSPVVEKRYKYARSVYTPKYVLEAYAYDATETVRRALAKNSATPSHVLDILAQEPGLLYLVLLNPNCSMDMIQSGLKQMNVQERVGLASYGVSSMLLTSLVKDRAKNVRWALAMNKATPVEVLHKLQDDRDSNVRDAATRHLLTRE